MIFRKEVTARNRDPEKLLVVCCFLAEDRPNNRDSVVLNGAIKEQPEFA
jgi:hypothetical protein